jgi:hypothetical protein
VPWDKSGKFQRVLLTLTRGTNQATTIDLTSLTLQELLAVREAVLVATQVAEPVVRALDDNARDRANNGDDSDPRVYRRLPTIAIRSGTLESYEKSILHGRQDVLLGIGAQFLPGNVPERPCGRVAELEEDGAGPPDE